jgi:hypothetical protein
LSRWEEKYGEKLEELDEKIKLLLCFHNGEHFGKIEMLVNDVSTQCQASMVAL